MQWMRKQFKRFRVQEPQPNDKVIDQSEENMNMLYDDEKAKKLERQRELAKKHEAAKEKFKGDYARSTPGGPDEKSYEEKGLEAVTYYTQNNDVDDEAPKGPSFDM